MSHLLFFLMGVSGSGKSTVGHQLSASMGIPFYDGDDFHPPENVRKMQAGNPLTDTDRAGWLERIYAFSKKELERGSLIVACSALKESYRRQLSSGIEDQVRWIFLEGPYELIMQRLQDRDAHFMPPELLRSQFQTLEPPSNAFRVSIQDSLTTILHHIQLKYPMSESAFGLIGLGVMGKSLSRNLASRGISLSLYNRYVPQTEEEVAIRFIREYPELNGARGFEDLGAFVRSLEHPRKILLMLPAGAPTDQVAEELVPLLQAGDILIDGGNAHFKQTEKRAAALAVKGIHWIGCGISGGEEGALKGPAIMPGGAPEAWPQVRPFLEAIAARDTNGVPCCDHVGRSGAGHFVKMVHNGIEYAEMQLIAEIYAIYRFGMKMQPDEISDRLDQWRTKGADSYLLEITTQILRRREGESWLLDQILDEAGNKGTGSWTTIAAAELGVAIPTITAALFARYQSALGKERRRRAKEFDFQPDPIHLDEEQLLAAYQLARLLNHLQGFRLIEAASEEYGWDVDHAKLARIWTNGCIIRSEIMQSLADALSHQTSLENIPLFESALAAGSDALLRLPAQVISARIPMPCLTASANYLLQGWQGQSTANLIQAQRDYFGAHTYRRVDDPTGASYHSNWESL